ncbi:MAG: imidazoleglycerol-phosphate dehydratase HisB [Deltaproteobacteria bacterium]
MHEPRTATIERRTTETQIVAKLNLDGSGHYQISSGIGFLDHMLELFSRHSGIDLELTVQGDLRVDEHHTVEDIGIVLGQAIKQALGDKRGIERYGFLLPMDESLAEVAIDLGGRAYLVWNVEFKLSKIGDLPTELLEDFFSALAANLGANIHINLRYGRNEHHKAEAIFKAFARALRLAKNYAANNLRQLPTTKGCL